MQRPRPSVPPEAIRIEDEVWQEAFTRREPARSRPRPRLHAIDGGGAAIIEQRPHTAAPPPAAPRTAAARRAAEPPAMAPAATAAPVAGGVPGRRTVTIRGQGAERNLPRPDAPRRRPNQRPYERPGFKPDRVAMWAVLLGILLVIVAIASAHG